MIVVLLDFSYFFFILLIVTVSCGMCARGFSVFKPFSAANTTRLIIADRVNMDTNNCVLEQGVYANSECSIICSLHNSLANSNTDTLKICEEQ